jgi:hypothetical protein
VAVHAEKRGDHRFVGAGSRGAAEVSWLVRPFAKQVRALE